MPESAWVVVKANKGANLERLGLFDGHTSSLSVTGRESMYEGPFPILGQGRLENGAKSDCCPTTQSRSNPVSGRGLPKTGTFQISAGDYRRFRSRSAQFRSPETDSQFAKARHWRAFLRVQRAKSPGAGMVGWGGRIRTSVWWNQNPLPYHLATPQKLSGNRRDWRPLRIPFRPRRSIDRVEPFQQARAGNSG